MGAKLKKKENCNDLFEQLKFAYSVHDSERVALLIKDILGLDNINNVLIGEIQDKISQNKTLIEIKREIKNFSA